MKIKLLMGDGSKARRVREPFPGADHALADGACPECGAQGDGEETRGTFAIAGTGRRPSKDDRAWEADGVCLACRKHVGVIRVETNTLFGVREDEAVLRGRCRVY
jgi:hypothetical protein